MAEKKTYKILTPPVMMTIVPGRDKPPASPITELRFDEVDLNEDDAAKLAANGTIDPTPIESNSKPAPAPEPETIELKPEPIAGLVLEEQSIAPESEPTESIKDYPPFDISEDATVVIPLIQMLDDRSTLERLLQDEQSGRNRKGVKNAINEQLGAL